MPSTYQSNYGSSVSPPYPSNTPLPQSKKRSSDMPTGPSVKRRKPSIASVTSLSVHPLRQTSFPPESSPAPRGRSPSVDNMSLVSGSAAGVTGKKKPRKSKKTANDDTASLAGGRAPTAISAVSGGGGGRSRSRRPSMDDDDDEVAAGMDVAIVARTKEEKETEKQHRAMLVGAFDDDQFKRYEIWRSSRLSDSIVRRLVNQTLSQSVPASVILAVKSVTKIYAGELIERARKIQTQWLELSGEDQTTGLVSPPPSATEGEAEGEDSQKTVVRRVPEERRRGPLTPDHLREALRRYKLERQGAVGLLGLGRHQPMTGAERFGIKSMGKRFFK